MGRITKLELTHNNETAIHDIGEEQAAATKNIINQSVDYAVVDEEDNVIVAVAGGHIRTKNFDSKTISASSGDRVFVMERGQIDYNTGFDAIPSYGSNTSYDTFKGQFNGYSRSAYLINVHGATSITVKGVQTFTCFSYNSSGQFISSSVASDGTVNLPQNTTFVRIQVFSQIDFIDIIADGNSSPLTEEKRVQMRSGEDIIVDGALKGVYEERLVFQVDGDMFTTALMYLPPNYTPNGKKVPLILWDSGDGSYRNWQTYHMGTGYASRVTGLKYLRDQGFAVVETYPWGSYNYYYHNGCGGRAAMPIPTHLKCEEKCVEYLCSRYNIDSDNIFHLSKSGSGKMALGYALRKPHFALKHIYAFAPVFDDLNFLGWGMEGYRAALYDELGLEGTQDQIDQFLNGTPVEKGGNGTSWKFGGLPSVASGLYANDQVFLDNVESNQQFILNNAEKFSLCTPGWINLCGQTIGEKVSDTIAFAETFWLRFVPLTEQPSSWSSTYTSYYEKIKDTYQKLSTQEIPPTFEPNTYYRRASSNPTSDDYEYYEEHCYTRHNLVMLGSGIPIKVIMAKNDEQTPYWNCAEVVSQLKNGGCDATIVALSSQGHSAPDMGSGSNAVASVTTMLGVEYASVSIGWHIACEDIMKRYLAHTDSEVYDYIHSNE